MINKIFTSLILLAGGQGARMGGGIPKQFRLLARKPLARYSFEIFEDLPEIDEIVIVCEPRFSSLFASDRKPLSFALPGKRRQDSVFNGLTVASKNADLICIHDAARPFVEKKFIIQLLEETIRCKAAAIAVPASNTIKKADQNRCVQCTLTRNELWELQTPQAIERSLLIKAFDHAHRFGIEATDDLSLIEALGEKTFLIEGSPRNFKITTPFDWALAEKLCDSN